MKNEAAGSGLLPCPCCGHRATLFRDYGGLWQIECENCELCLPPYASPETAKMLWNRRRSDGLRSWLESERNKAADNGTKAEVRAFENSIKQMDKLLNESLGL